jgi:hypothetical protein
MSTNEECDIVKHYAYGTYDKDTIHEGDLKVEVDGL